MSAESTDLQGVDAAAMAALLGNAQIVGNPRRAANHPAPIHAVVQEGAVSFCSAVGSRAADLIAATRASIVICATSTAPELSVGNTPTLILVEAPRLAFLRVVQRYFSRPRPQGVHPAAFIDATATLGDNVYIGPGAFVGARCEIGNDTVVYGNVQLYEGTRLGQRVTVHAGTVIGADGFGYERNDAGELEKFPHVGGVVIEDDVEIGANTCIDRGTLGDTVIRKGARIDNLVHIAHNVVVGQHVAVIAHAMIGGSTVIGDYAWVAPCACVRDGITIGERSVVGLGAVVVKPVADGDTVMGAPARPAAQYKALLGALATLGTER